MSLDLFPFFLLLSFICPCLRGKRGGSERRGIKFEGVITSEAWSEKSNEQIIAQQAKELKDHQRLHPTWKTVLSQKMGVNGASVEDPPCDKVATSRMTISRRAFGTKQHVIWPSEGGDDPSQRPGDTSARSKETGGA
ncbi:hypothetical protein IE53DRAFT_361319 [Violaceomyces palustris]|uniref:Uncharacterized protein n=1 Tax=Violaceomyces palustris TaxID=1673888 RepID=A0ACD0P133_9BASI|nr:hypothetical protein IE53DRAFT_361319 [Violaceomyces palustris]